MPPEIDPTSKREQPDESLYASKPSSHTVLRLIRQIWRLGSRRNCLSAAAYVAFQRDEQCGGHLPNTVELFQSVRRTTQRLMTNDLFPERVAISSRVDPVILRSIKSQ